MQIGDKVKLLRKERGLTQSQLGDAIGQERSTIACYESGKRTPDVVTLEKLAAYFKVSLDYFSTKSEADIMVELLARTNSFFSANNVSAESKTKAMNTIMRLYLESTKEEKNFDYEERGEQGEAYTTTTERKTQQN